MTDSGWEEYVAEVGREAAIEQTLEIWAAVKRASKELTSQGITVNEHELFDMFCEHCIINHVQQKIAERPGPFSKRVVGPEGYPVGPGRGWHGEPGRHKAAAKKGKRRK